MSGIEIIPFNPGKFHWPNAKIDCAISLGGNTELMEFSFSMK